MKHAKNLYEIFKIFDSLCCTVCSVQTKPTDCDNYIQTITLATSKNALSEIIPNSLIYVGKV